MTTEELLSVINNSYIKSISVLSDKLKVICPEIYNFVIIDKQDMGYSGILSTARFYFGKDEIIVKGFLYPTDTWSEETHGYIVAKKI